MKPDTDFSRFVRFPNVELGEPCDVGAFVILGEPPRGHGPGDLALRIGAGACIRSHAVIYAGNVIGSRFQTGHHVLIRENNEIGDNVSIGSGTVIEHSLKIGDDVRIHSQGFIPEFSVIENGVWIGPNVVVTNARYPNTPDTKHNLEGVVFEEGCMVGANVTILPGVRIGKRALIGAGSVVTRNVEPGSVMVGNPARPMRQLGELPAYQFLQGKE